MLAWYARAESPTTQPAMPNNASPTLIFAPPKNYRGELLDRSTLTGDWDGLRSQLADQGITLDASLTQVTQGLMGAGKHNSWYYGGRFEAELNLDFEKLGLWKGAYIWVEF
jgi:hypothetical protein